MTSRGKLVERRKYKRFQVPKGAFVGVGPYNAKVGPLRDLSMGGLAFCYVGREEPESESYLDLFCTDNNFFLGHLPFKTVLDCETVEKIPSRGETMRRCGVRFGKLTPAQKAQIEYFIQNHATGEV
jgi:c-di-GMP-binding flagellar brake protein YcgR